MPCVPQLASRLRQCDSHEVISEVEACPPLHCRAERFFICSLNVYVRKEPLQILPQSDLVDAARCVLRLISDCRTRCDLSLDMIVVTLSKRSYGTCSS